MNPLFFFHDCFCRATKQKKTIIVFLFLFLCSTVCGILFVKTPVIYTYHLNICDRYVDRICYSSRSVFLIFLERAAGNALILLLFICTGFHTIGLAVAPLIFIFRSYVFGGSLTIFFTVYRFSGALIVLVLYLPIHLLLDAVFLFAISISFQRAPRFRFCGNDIKELLCDFLCLLIIIIVICLLEAILLAALFHPLGYLL